HDALAVVERLGGGQVDCGAQRAFFHFRRLGFTHGDAVEQLRGEDLEVEPAATIGAPGAVLAAGGGQGFQAVQAHAGEVVGETPHGDGAAFAAVAVDGHAGDA